jgi:hypothetical protein
MHVPFIVYFGRKNERINLKVEIYFLLL